MIVTLFSDASICPIKGVVGWAAWAKSDRGVVRGDGVLRRSTIDSSVAEAMALANGLALAATGGLVARGDVVVAQTDCNTVMGILSGTTQRAARRRNRMREDIDEAELAREADERNREIREISTRWKASVRALGVRIVWRHCKGHRHHDDVDARAAVNGFCDRTAKERMRAARDGRRSEPVRHPRRRPDRRIAA